MALYWYLFGLISRISRLPYGFSVSVFFLVLVIVISFLLAFFIWVFLSLPQPFAFRFFYVLHLFFCKLSGVRWRWLCANTRAWTLFATRRRLGTSRDSSRPIFSTGMAQTAVSRDCFCGESSVVFLRAIAGTAIARLSHRNSVCLSVCLSVTRVDQAKTVQARIIKSSPSAAPKTLVSGSVTIFQKFHRGHPDRGP